MFKVGDEVVCVDATPYPGLGNGGLYVGQIYTVEGFQTGHSRLYGKGIGVFLKEVSSPAGFGAYDSRRFRPVVRTFSFDWQALRKETVERRTVDA